MKEKINVISCGLSLDKGQKMAALKCVDSHPDLLKLLPEGKKPFDLWHLFESNLSDASTFVEFQKYIQKIKRNNIETHFVYCGLPYYKVWFVESILLRIDGVENLQEKYAAFFASYAEHVKAILSKKINEFDCVNRRSNLSRFGFGIKFLSGFLHHLCHQDSKYNTEFKEKNLPENEELKKKNKVLRKLGLQIYKLCSAPSNIASSDIQVTVEDIYGIGFSLSLNANSTVITDPDLIRIPLLRFFALPNYDIFSLPNTDEQNDFVKYPYLPPFQDNNNIGIIFVGGAEHNLPLLHIVNELRWEQGSKRKYLIAENMFDDQIEIKSFRLGTENIVYGINSQMRWREDNANEAEVFGFGWKETIGEQEKNFQVYSVYGFSAPMTKIAFLSLVALLYENNKGDLAAKLDNEHLKRLIPETNTSIAYELGDIKKRTDFYESNILKYFDENDMMNNPDSINNILLKIKVIGKFDV